MSVCVTSTLLQYERCSTGQVYGSPMQLDRVQEKTLCEMMTMMMTIEMRMMIEMIVMMVMMMMMASKRHRQTGRTLYLTDRAKELSNLLHKLMNTMLLIIVRRSNLQHTVVRSAYNVK
jgi:hypothetical protein